MTRTWVRARARARATAAIHIPQLVFGLRNTVREVADLRLHCSTVVRLIVRPGISPVSYVGRPGSELQGRESGLHRNTTSWCPKVNRGLSKCHGGGLYKNATKL